LRQRDSLCHLIQQIIDGLLVGGGLGLQKDALLLAVDGESELFDRYIGDARFRAIDELKLP
jgi:hypothetical protein